MSADTEKLGGPYEPEDLYGVAFRLYEKFRPEIAEVKVGCGAKSDE
jgi:hypothetical protein